MPFNSDQIFSFVRWLLTSLGAFLVTNGFVNSNDFATATSEFMTILGALLPLASLIWSMIHHSAPTPAPVPVPTPAKK